ncbi:MAG: putative transcriptional regulator of viral defense system [Candidatus Omnitrophota bacterium]|jgi:predicted transcriptional regulator of viral defense system
MKYELFIQKVQNLPLVDTKLFLAGQKNSGAMKVQISRWEGLGKLIQLRRGIYLLPRIYQKKKCDTFYIGNYLKRPSYVSFEKALEFYGLIPEAVFICGSVTTKRPVKYETDVGVFDYKHIQTKYFWGYDSLTLNNETIFIALPEKALLDFFYFNAVDPTMGYLKGMRLQNLEQINLERLFAYAKRFAKPKMLNTAQILKQYMANNADEVLL